MEQSGKSLIILPEQEFNEMKQKIDLIPEIYQSLQEAGKIKTQDYYSIKEFMKLAHIARNTFEKIKNQLSIKKVSPRKFLVPHSDLVRWLNGEFQTI